MAMDPNDVEDFLSKVSEASILIEGLSKGTITPDYVDTKLHNVDKPGSKTNVQHAITPGAPRPVAPSTPTRGAAPTPSAAAADDSDPEAETKKAEEEAERRERLMEKALALKANYERKQRARKRFEEYTTEQKQAKAGTDYTRWDMWCPSDEEDDLINSITPNSAAFRAMEKDIDERHNKMVEQRQIAERMRVKGNEAFKDLQYSEALRCYQEGLASERTNMALHSNAAMAALKIQCYVQAVEHCDKALNIADFLHNNLKDPLCTKTYQRRATAYRALQQYSKAVQDLERAAENDPESKEIQQQLRKARAELEEYRKQKQVKKALKKQQEGGGQGTAGKEGEQEGGAEGLDVGKLRRVEQLVQRVQQLHQQGPKVGEQGQAQPESKQVQEGDGATGQAGTGAAQRGPQLPARTTKAKAASKTLGAGAEAASGDGQGTDSAAAEVAVTDSNPDTLVACCSELMKLIDGDDFACVYLRECGGLQAAAQVVLASSREPAQTPPSSAAKAGSLGNSDAPSPATATQGDAAACFALLNAACANDANLLLLPSLGVLPAAVQALGGTDGLAAEAALRLLCTAATCEDVRKRLSPLLGTDDGLRSMFRLLAAASNKSRVVALAVLGNCMVDSGAREAMRKLLCGPQVSSTSSSSKPSGDSASANVGPCLVALLSSPSAAVQEKALTLCGNMCGHEALRGALAGQKGLVDAAASALLAPPPPMAGTEASQQQWELQLLGVQQAASAMLYNLSLDPEVQGALLERPAEGQAVGGAGAGTESRVDEMLLMLQRPECELRLAARVAGIVARCFKHPQRPRQLPGSFHQEHLLALLRRCCSEGAPAPAAASPAQPPAPALDEDSPAAAAADAAVRCLTLLTAEDGPDGLAACDHMLKQGGAAALQQLIQQLVPTKQASQPAPASTGPPTKAGPAGGLRVLKKTHESMLGNSALCLGHLARSEDALPLLHKLDVVQALVAVAYEGKGSTSSKNAAIALARMAKHPGMLERLRELHGIEIIYQYVRP